MASSTAPDRAQKFNVRSGCSPGSGPDCRTRKPEEGKDEVGRSAESPRTDSRIDCYCGTHPLAESNDCCRKDWSKVVQSPRCYATEGQSWPPLAPAVRNRIAGATGPGYRGYIGDP